MATSSSVSQFSAVKNSSERLFVAGVIIYPSHVIFLIIYIYILKCVHRFLVVSDPSCRLERLKLML